MGVFEGARTGPGVLARGSFTAEAAGAWRQHQIAQRNGDCPTHRGYIQGMTDLISFVLVLLVLVLWIVSLASIKDSSHGNATNLTLWAMVVTFAPVVGAIVWFSVGKSILKNRA